MKVALSAFSPDDRKPVIDIFNYYVGTGFAAYPELRMSESIRPLHPTDRNWTTVCRILELLEESGMGHK